MMSYTMSSKRWESCEEWHHTRHQHYPERFPQRLQGYYCNSYFTNFHALSVILLFFLVFIIKYIENTKHETIIVNADSVTWNRMHAVSQSDTLKKYSILFILYIESVSLMAQILAVKIMSFGIHLEVTFS